MNAIKEPDVCATDVAIVGMAGRFPGAPNVAEFWLNLANGVESVSFFSDEQLLNAGVDPALLRNPKYVRAAALLEGVELFDAEFFGIKPTEASIMDPQQRLFLECAWEALESAGYDPGRYNGAIGVFGGSNSSDYLGRARANPELLDLLGGFFAQIANDKDYLTTRVSYKLNLKGPSVAVQTACSTSLVAIHLACQSVLNGECDMALAGGVGISKVSCTGYLYEQGGIHSPDGHCRAFDAKAQGTVSGCGLGIIVLKRLGRALEDGNVIHAVIKGSAINNDGTLKASFTAPSVEGQAKVISEALAVAGVDPDTVGYVEAHGTGTHLGDPIEFAALTKAFRASTSRKGFCALGSVKANIGHLTAAAGVAAVIKTVMALKNSTLPHSPYFERPNPEIDLANSPFYLNTTSKPWPRNGSPRRAGVSSLGIGGTNAHVILEEAPVRGPSGPSGPWQLLPWSAKSTAALDAMTGNLKAFLEDTPSTNLADVAYTLQTGRACFEHRRVMVCQDTMDALSALASPDHENLASGTASGEGPLAIFLFPGGGAQHVGMGAELYASDRNFRNDVERCFEIIRPLVSFDLKEILGFAGKERGTQTDAIDTAGIAHPALFIIEYCLARLWMRWGIRPSGLIGHSMGEYAAAAIAGVFTLENALRAVVARGRLMERVPAGIMLVVPLAQEDVRPFLNEKVSLAAVNAPTSCVLSGFSDAIEEIEERLKERSIDCRRLRFSHASHSPLMEPILQEFAEEIRRAHPKPPELPLISNVTGTWITAEEASDPQYWSSHLRNTVRFSEGLKHILSDSSRLLVETGPGRTIEKLVRRQGPQFAGRSVLTSLGSPEDQTSEVRMLLGSLGGCWLQGMQVDWDAFRADEKRRRVELPAYPFQRKRYWIDQPAPVRSDASLSRAVAGKTAHNDSVHSDRARNDNPNTEGSLMPRIASIDSLSENPAQKTAGKVGPVGASRIAAIEAELTETVARLFGYDAKDIKQSSTFLEMGADSLLLMRVSRTLEDRFNVVVPFRLLMSRYPSIASLARHLDPLVAKDVGDQQPAEPQPLITRSPAAEPGGPGGDAGSRALSNPVLHEVVLEQLRIMSSQLELLGRSTAPRVSPGTTESFAKQSEMVRVREAMEALPGAAVTADVAQAGKSSAEALAFGPFKPIQTAVTQAMSSQQAEHLAGLIGSYTDRTRKSRQWAETYRIPLADPRAAAGFQFEWKDMIYPIVGARSRGSKIWDVDGNEYIDYTMGFGVHLFGHSPDFLMEALAEQLSAGIHIGPQSESAGRVAELIAEMTGMERIAFCNTGTEAVMGALRLARAATGRRKIVTFAGAYHGTFDGVLARGRVSNGRRETLPASAGTPPNMTGDVIVLEYGSPESLRVIEGLISDLAAVIVEPVQSRNLDLQPKEFLRELRQITTRGKAALIFDEIIWGFRLQPRGAQGWFGVRADLAVYGKVLGGGLPIGVIAGGAEFLDAVDGGRWTYGDNSVPAAEQIVFAGTFSKNPLAMAAAKAILERLKKVGPKFQEDLNARTGELVGRLRDLFQEYEVPLKVSSFGSMFRFIRQPAAKTLDLALYYALQKGIYIWEGRGCFLSAAHSSGDIDALVSSMKYSVEKLQQGGFLSATGRRASAAGGAAGPAGPDRSMSEKVITHQILSLTAPLRQLLVHAQLSREASLAYNEMLALRFSGDLNMSAMNAAVKMLIDRHEVLRTTFDAQTESLTIASDMTCEIECTDSSEDYERMPEGTVRKLLDENLGQPFDLERGPLFQIRVYRLKSREFLFVLVFHHLIMDGLSVNIFIRELGEFYNANVENRSYVPRPTMRFSDYVLERLKEETGAESAAARVYMLNRMLGAPQFQLRGDHFDSGGKGAMTGSRKSLLLPLSLAERINRESAKCGCTAFQFYLAAFLVLLHRWSGQEDLTIGIPSLRRTFKGDENLLAHSVDLLPIRSSLNGDLPLASYIESIRDEVLMANEHASFGYSRLAPESKLGDLQAPIISITFNLDPAEGSDRSATKFSGIEAKRVVHEIQHVKFDVHWNLSPGGSGVQLSCDYNADRFQPETIQAMMNTYRQILEEALADARRPVSSIPLLNACEREAILRGLNSTIEWASLKESIPRLFTESAQRMPTRTAVIWRGEKLTYEDLDRRSTQLARFLRARGVGLEDRVGLCAEPGIEMVLGMLGILKAGGAYVPLDPAYPADRLAFIATDSMLSLLLTQGHLRPVLADLSRISTIALDFDWSSIAAAGDAASPLHIRPENAAYVIYTSGSTGQPKGVVVTHRGVVRLVRNTDYVEFNADKKILQVAPFTFDASTFEIWGALLNGGSVVSVPREIVLSPTGLTTVLRDQCVTTLFLTPALFNEIAREAPEGFAGVHDLLVGGDAPSPKWVQEVLAKGPPARLLNGYGPTENTTFSAWHLISHVPAGATTVPIGKAIRNTSVYVLDSYLQPVPVGVPGELYVGGAGLARGYLNRPDLTAERFVPHPYSDEGGARLYRTGDIARCLNDGNLEFLGRVDNQVKIRGYRIEPGEVEAILARCPDVKESAVVARADEPGEKKLVAYLWARGDSGVDLVRLRADLKRTLPGYMVPSAFVVLDRVPVTPNGKLDRSALPPPPAFETSMAEYTAPGTATEEILAGIWIRILAVPRVGIHDDFFELGGDSLRAMRVISQIREAMGIDVSIATLFDHASIAKLGHLIDALITDQPQDALCFEGTGGNPGRGDSRACKTPPLR